jgi:probable F420-dependent oxidoreductase
VREIKFNLVLPIASFNRAKTWAERADSQGFYSVSCADHMFTRTLFLNFERTPAQPQMECYTTLAAVAAVTKRVRLVPFITPMKFRSPAILAKMLATIDQISGGRVIAGLGAGWQREELDNYGYGFATNVERIERLDEGIKILKAMWTEEEPSFHGRHYTIDQAHCFPKPIQKPHPPIMMGGSGRKVLEIAAREANIMNLVAAVYQGSIGPRQQAKFDNRQLHRKIAELQELARAAGRDPDSIELSGFPLVLMSESKSEADAMAKAAGDAAGIADLDELRRLPMSLIGAPDEIKRELRYRIEEFNVTYHFLALGSPEAVELFSTRVMPEFTSAPAP